MDGITPDCQTAAGCIIPKLDPEGRRVMEIHDLLTSKLTDLVDPGTICRICDVDLVDLKLLAAMQEILSEGTKHGEGH